MRPTSAPRRGVTLVEMLVTVALLVLVMSILVAIFRSAAGAISVSRTYAALDQNLRRIDTVIREDLQGVTARMTPPLDPRNNLGYFEYGENTLADVQGDDTDDYLAFTAKAPAGRPFTGRVTVQQTNALGAKITGQFQQITITSDFAEIIYFLRNGNLYRRVLLILANRPGTLSVGTTTGGVLNVGGGYSTAQFSPSLGATVVSWQGMNDVSARPSVYNPSSLGATSYIPTPNTLGDLTNRENRFGRPRFADDFATQSTGALPADGFADDLNSNGIPDYYPTLFPAVLTATFPSGTSMLNEVSPKRVATTSDLLAFPYVFPVAYSKPTLTAGVGPTTPGSIHGLYPQGIIVGTTSPASPPYLPNHAPLESGDSLVVPSSAAETQTWWGFPTWRETLSRTWTDPVKRINDPTGSTYFSAGTLYANDKAYTQAPGLSWTTPTLLPPVATQPFNDGAGNATAFMLVPGTAGSSDYVYEDDLLLTGVRSFDVKAYDNAPGYWNPSTSAFVPSMPGYYDLGYGDKDNQAAALQPTFAADLLTFNHEGRMPPLTTDNRTDPSYPVTAFDGVRNIGVNAATVVRMRRVFDTWSTDYTNAPAVPINPWQGPPFASPVYPSYPPPYPVALRGIQIEVRLADPKNERTKTLTIRQDFTDKL